MFLYEVLEPTAKVGASYWYIQQIFKNLNFPQRLGHKCEHYKCNVAKDTGINKQDSDKNEVLKQQRQKYHYPGNSMVANPAIFKFMYFGKENAQKGDIVF